MQSKLDSGPFSEAVLDARFLAVSYEFWYTVKGDLIVLL